MDMEVEFFDSLEEAQACLRQAMEAADSRVKPWQAAVKVGDCFVADGDEEDLVVFGEVLEGYQEAHLRHYRFCRCFSVACPEGEVGDVHVSTVLCLVSRAFFEAMRQAGWQMEAGQRPRSSCAPTLEVGLAGQGSQGPSQFAFPMRRSVITRLLRPAPAAGLLRLGWRQLRLHAFGFANQVVRVSRLPVFQPATLLIVLGEFGVGMFLGQFMADLTGVGQDVPLAQSQAPSSLAIQPCMCMGRWARA
jgi:hypothetical protein